MLNQSFFLQINPKQLWILFNAGLPTRHWLRPTQPAQLPWTSPQTAREWFLSCVVEIQPCLVQDPVENTSTLHCTFLTSLTLQHEVRMDAFLSPRNPPFFGSLHESEKKMPQI